jgi:hypothetical protein
MIGVVGISDLLYAQRFPIILEGLAVVALVIIYDSDIVEAICDI